MNLILLLQYLLFGLQYSAPDGCKKPPNFVTKTGLNPNNVAYSTSERKVKGIVLLDLTNGKYFQHPSWKSAGSLGPVSIDELGNAYTVPIPVINVLNNKPQDQNKVYYIDTNTGEFKILIDIPHQKQKSDQNPFGMLGITYDCDTKLIYTSSVANSTIDKELGKIYIIDKTQKTIVDSLENMDCMGLNVIEIDNSKQLLVGNTRNSNVYSIKLDEKGRFSGKPILAFSLQSLGERGDDIARKIKLVKGKLVVYGIEFNYNLIAPTEKQETIYNFTFDGNSKKWVFDSYGN
jgi:hypothetical protein